MCFISSVVVNFNADDRDTVDESDKESEVNSDL